MRSSFFVCVSLAVFATACSLESPLPEPPAPEAPAPVVPKDAGPPPIDAESAATFDAPHHSAPPEIEPCPAVTPSAVPASLGLDPFYEKYVDASGLPIVSSKKVSDAAFRVALHIVSKMTSTRVDLLPELTRNNVRVGIIATTEVTTDMPEHHDLYEAFPMIDWDYRARGLGATLERPLSSVGEENLLRLGSDSYRGESIMVHEFSHTLFDLGVWFTPEGGRYTRRLERAYDRAMTSSRWRGTYAATRPTEFWAEGVQSFFDANLQATPTDGIHNFIDTRAELFEHEPELASLILDVFGDARWLPYCDLGTDFTSSP